MKRLLLTGAAGFIGAHCVEGILASTDWHIIAMDSTTYAGDVNRFADMDGFDPDRVTIIWHDLRSPLLDHPNADRIGDVDYIINMAAGSHVDRSIADPAPFIRNNVDITLNLLEWVRATQRDAKVIQVSTDEVYGPAPDGYSHVEWDPIRPSNPYAGSKACQEAIAFSYWRTYGLQLAVSNTMNNIGERQHPEKFLPMVIRNLIKGEPVTLHGRPIYHNPGDDGIAAWRASSRVWLHARNHADALRWLLAEYDFPVYDPANDDGTSRPVRFNVAGEREIGVDEIVQMCATILDVKPRITWVDFHGSRPGHDLRYSLDGTALREAGWKAPVSLDESFERTVRWYLANPAWLGL